MNRIIFFNSFLFKLAIFGTNYIIQAAKQIITRCLKVTLRYFGTFPAKLWLDKIDILIVFSAKFYLPKYVKHSNPRYWHLKILLSIVLWQPTKILLFFQPFLVNAVWVQLVSTSLKKFSHKIRSLSMNTNERPTLAVMVTFSINSGDF